MFVKRAVTTAKKVSRNILSSLNLLRVNNSSHNSDDVMIKEKVTLETACEWRFILAAKQIQSVAGMEKNLIAL